MLNALEKIEVGTGDGGGQPPLSKAEVRRFKKLAGKITGDVHLAAILQTAPYESREVIYNQIVPWVSFQAKPFSELKFF